MAGVLEEMDERFVMELIMAMTELKVQLKMLQNENAEQKDKILMLEQRIENITGNAEQRIENLTGDCIMLEAENVFLKQKVMLLEDRQLKEIQACSSSSLTQTIPSSARMNFSLAVKSTEPKILPTPILRLLVARLDLSVDESALQAYFSRFGEIIDTFLREGEYAFVAFSKLFGESPLDQPKHVINGSSVYIEEIKNYGKDGEPSNRLFITGSIQSDSDDDIIGHFYTYGKVVDFYRPLGKNSNKPSRCAFIAFESIECADKALNVEHHYINGHYVYVKRAKSCMEAPPIEVNKDWNVQRPKRHRRPRNKSKSENRSLTLLLSADPSVWLHLKDQDLHQFFSRFGKIVSIRKPVDSRTKQPLHFAFVEFASSDSVDKAIENRSYCIKNHNISVNQSRQN